MNTIQVQLNDWQFALLDTLLDYADDHLSHLISIEGDAEIRAQFLKEKEGRSILGAVLTSTKSYLWTSSMGDIELEIPASIVDEVAQSRDNLPAVEATLTEHPYIGAQLNRYSSEVIEAEIDETGIEQPAHTMNVRTLHQYLLWMACWDIHEQQYQED